MNTLKRYRYHILAMALLITLLLVGARTKMSQVSHNASELPPVKMSQQQIQAFEILPRRDSTIPLFATYGNDQRRTIFNIVSASLPQGQKGAAFEIARTVISEANHHGMDPFFLLAVITTESKFDSLARGAHGEIGLMQVLPSTAAWLSVQSGLPSNSNLEEPAVNIRVGATYLAHLRRKFNRQGSRYLAAYNMGPKNVRRLLAQQTDPDIYPARVLKNYRQIYKSLGDAPMSGKRSIASVN